MVKVKQRQALNLSPLSFDEAVTDILKIRPEPKPPKKKAKTEKRVKSKL